MSTQRGYPLTVCDKNNRFNLTVPSLDVNTVLWFIGQYSPLNDVTGWKHLFWQPNNMSNVRILLNSHDYGRLFDNLQSQRICTIYIGEETLKERGLTISTYFDNFLDNQVPEVKENLCKTVTHEGPATPAGVAPEAAPSEQVNLNPAKNVVVPREVLETFTKQLSKLEESLDRIELEQKVDALASKGPDYKISGSIDIPEDKPELVNFFMELTTLQQLEDVFHRYHAYEKLLDNCGGKTKTIWDFAEEKITVCQDPEVVSECSNDRSLQITVDHRDNSLYFQLYNCTNSLLAGNCKLRFTDGHEKVNTCIIEMGPHEIGIKEHRELRYFPYTPKLTTASTIEIENEYGEVIFVGNRNTSPRINLKPPSRLSAESLQVSQEPFYDFRTDTMPELDDSSIISTSISISGDDDDDDYDGKVLTWEKL